MVWCSEVNATIVQAGIMFGFGETFTSGAPAAAGIGGPRAAAQPLLPMCAAFELYAPALRFTSAVPGVAHALLRHVRVRTR